MDIELDLLGPCNYSCPYCIGDGPANPYPKPFLHDLDRLAEIYKPLKGDTVLRARGTEPALHPQTAAIASICTTAGQLLITTNLSIPVHRWLSGPKNIDLLITIHPEAKTRTLMKYLRQAVDLGYHVRVQALGDAKDFALWAKRLESIGVTEPFKVLHIRTHKAWIELSAQTPAALPGSICEAGHSYVLISYGHKHQSGVTRLYRCPVRMDVIPRVLTAPEPCSEPMADTRCEVRVQRG